MSQEETTGRLAVGKGCELVFKLDKSVATDSIDYRWTEFSYDGHADSLVAEVAPHWHKYHDEIMKVKKGRVSFMLDGKTSILTPEDPPLRIPKWHAHGLKFLKGEAAMLTERTDPTGEFKQVFFEDLLDDGSLNTLSAIRASYYGDTYLALPGGIKWLEQAITIGCGWLVSYCYPQKHKGMLAESIGKNITGTNQ